MGHEGEEAVEVWLMVFVVVLNLIVLSVVESIKV